MLKKMYLTNFKSFVQKTEFDFSASKYSILSETNVYSDGTLKGALFIGPNASGKSNALAGISFLIDLIKGEGVSIDKYHCFFVPNPVTTAEYEFSINGKTIDYMIEYDKNEQSLSERLSIDNTLVIKRNGNKGQLKYGDSFINDHQLDNNTLFLRTASFNTGRFPQEPTLRALMDYINNSYYIDGYNQGAHWGNNITKYVEEYGVKKVNSYLQDLNYDFFIEYGIESKGAGVTISHKSNQKSVFLKRKSYPIPNVFYTESQGNQVFIDMLPYLISVIEKPGMLVFDEFGNSLHNYLAEKIVRFFMEKAKESQLFITSHHTNLISNSVFRPDQINLISFMDKKGSKVERLSTYKPREAQNLEKMYLSGMFEGLPTYEKLQN